MKRIEVTLKTAFPELQYLLPIFNRLIIQGNSIKVEVRKTQNLDAYYLFIRLRRCKVYSFIEIRRDLSCIDKSTLQEISLISDEDILYFETDNEGKTVIINVVEEFNSIPQIIQPNVPEISSYPLETKKSTECFAFSFDLRKDFTEIDYLIQILNVLLTSKVYAGLCITKKHHLELMFWYNPNDFRPSLKIGFGISSALSCSDITTFNRIFNDDYHIASKFYSFPSPYPKRGPHVVFKATKIL